MMRKALLFMLLSAITFFIIGCEGDVTGVEVSTTFNQDSSVVTVIGIGFLPPEEDGSGNSDIDCSLDEGAPPGSSADIQVRGSETWCVITIPSANLEELRAFYEELGEEMVKINCLQFKDDLFLYDLELFSAGAEESDDGGGSEGAFTWLVTLPGRIEASNADSQEGNTLSWFWSTNFSPADLPFSVRANLGEDESCPSGTTELSLFINDDGAGSATLLVPIPATSTDLEAELTEDLRGLGWEIVSVVPPDGSGGPGAIEGSRSYESAGGLNQIIQNVPGFGGTSSSLQLTVSDVEGTEQRVYDFTGRQLDMLGHQSYWELLDDSLPTPGFELTVFPPGSVESTSGAWTFPNQLVMTWEAATGLPAVSLSFRSVLDPENEADDSYEVEANIETITDRFLTETEIGQIVRDPTYIQQVLSTYMSPGKVNNLTNGQLYACGDFQTRVLKWLDDIRLNPDPAIRDQLRGLDYGPIQAYHGGHQAVVLFPKGSDWQTAGTVLDPWPNQIPEVFTMDAWTDRFPIGVGVGQGGENYPHLYGGDSFYRGTSLSTQARLNSRQIGVNSPVDVLVTGSDGRRVGALADGSLVYEIEGADLYKEPNEDGTTQWLFGLPAGDYTVSVTGTGSGDYHVIVGDGQGELVTYPPQPIKAREQATLKIEQNSIEAPLTARSGESVQPIRVTDENVDGLEFGEPRTRRETAGETGVDDTGVDDTPLVGDLDSFGSSVSFGTGEIIASGVLLLSLCGIGLLVLGAILYFGFYRRRQMGTG